MLTEKSYQIFTLGDSNPICESRTSNRYKFNSAEEAMAIANKFKDEDSRDEKYKGTKYVIKMFSITTHMQEVTIV